MLPRWARGIENRESPFVTPPDDGNHDDHDNDDDYDDNHDDDNDEGGDYGEEDFDFQVTLCNTTWIPSSL